MSDPGESPAVPPSPAGVQWWHRRWVRWTAGAAGIVLALVVLVLLLWPATAWWVEHVDGVDLDGRGAPTGTERLEVLDKARGRITAVATGILAAVAIYYTASNARSARQTAEAALRSVDHNEAAQRRTHELTERGQVTDRFTAAVAQLGEASPAVRLGGVHALAGIADDAPAMRQTCIDVLCAYLRLPYTPAPGPLDEDQQAAITAEERQAHERRRAEFQGRREVRHTIIRLIGNHLRLPADDPRSWQGHDFDFTGVIFDGGNLHSAHFTAGTVDFTRATFTDGFDFGDASFSGGQVSFVGARFSGGRVSFVGATFSAGQVDFSRATFSAGQVDFRRATFSGGQVDFRGTEFSAGRVGFVGATFSGGRVDFSRASFSGGRVSFVDATFSAGQVDFSRTAFFDGWVGFRRATFSGGQVDFRGAEFSGGRVDLSAARSWEVPPVGIPVDEEGTPPEGVSLPESR